MAKDAFERFRGILPPSVPQGARVCVALSGGRDSVCLLHCLLREPVQVVAANVEHGIRGEESKADTRFVQELCAEWGVELRCFEADAPAYCKQHGLTLEQGARELRYSFFDALLEEGFCDYIALAHHRDDQVETVLMRIFRGTGIRGLQGMKKQNGRYLRPLLDVTREEITAYCKAHGLSFVEDASNEDAAYSRNFIRSQLSVLSARFPSLGQAVARLSKNACEVESYLDAQTPKYEVYDGEVYIKTSDLVNTLLAKRVIIKGAEELGVKQDIEDRHLKAALELASSESGKYLMLTHGLNVHRQGDMLVLSKRRPAAEDIEIPFGEGEYPELGVRVRLLEKLPENLKAEDGTLYVSADGVEDAVFRRRKVGDYINKFGGGRKSLGDYLTDKKYPLRKRAELTVLACGNRILAVVGVDISSDVAVREDSERAYAIEKI